MEEKSNDKDKDAGASKLQRLLSSHSLQGLVYQKRQRKQTHNVNPFTQLNIKSPQPPKKKIVKLQKQKSKKIIKAQKKQQKAQKKSSSKSKNKGKQKVVKKQVKKSEKNKKEDQNSKKRGRPKKLLKQQQSEKQEGNDIGTENKQQIGEKQIDKKEQCIQRIKQEQIQSQQQQQVDEEQQQNVSQQSEEQQEQQYQQKKKSTNIKQIAKNLKQKQKQISESIGEKQKLNEPNEPDINNKQLHQPRNIVQNNNPQIKTIEVHHVASIPSHNEQIKQPENQIQIKKKVYGRPKKSATVNQDVKNIPNDQLDNNEQIAVQQNQKIQQEQQKEKSSQAKRTLRIRRRFNNIIDIPPIIDPKKQQQHQSQKQCANPRKRRLRLRKTKDDTLKKFNMFEGFSQDQQNQNYQIRKRKGISDKQYQINRIFRKTQRVNLPNVKLDVDLMVFSMENFISRFKSFDLIHCSLPLDMLIRLPSIGNLINKGFIFIWVDKGQIQIGYHWLSRIGFDVIDQIMWVKTNETVSQVKCDINSQNQIFPNCRSTCLVGYKCSSNQKTEYCTKISNNLIFSADRPATIQKPDQIYQIGDLMMPGARKLQIGFKQLGGWFTLKHIQTGLIRCYKCLRRCKNSLLLTQNKQVLCKQCIQNNKEKQNKEEQQNQGEQKLKKNSNEQKSYPLNIQVKKYQQYPQIQCQNCKKIVHQAIIQSKQNKQQNIEQIRQQIFYCKNCFTLSEQVKQVTVFNRQQVYFPKKYITCTNCSKMCLYKYYFQCSSCKNDHNLCSKCFYQSNPPKSQSQNQKQKEQNPVQHKNDIKIHDWKLKFLYQQPDTRVACFQCNQQCAIPYWGCQTCQSWYWCGKCKSTQIPKAHQHHCHYNREHHLHLII